MHVYTRCMHASKKNLSYLDEDNKSRKLESIVQCLRLGTGTENRYVHVCIIHIGIIHAGKSVTKIVTLQYTEVTDAYGQA